MNSTIGYNTKSRILTVAEQLFGTNGFDATSVEQIAKQAGVNKSLIYYHFTNKRDLILEMFRGIISEVIVHSENKSSTVEKPESSDSQSEIISEINFLLDRKRVLSVMLSEALKSTQSDDLLFKCAELVMQKEHGDFATNGSENGESTSRFQLVQEFFTGFIPMVLFVALRDRWSSYFGFSPDEVTESFVKAFTKSHISNQARPGDPISN